MKKLIIGISCLLVAGVIIAVAFIIKNGRDEEPVVPNNTPTYSDEHLDPDQLGEWDKQ